MEFVGGLLRSGLNAEKVIFRESLPVSSKSMGGLLGVRGGGKRGKAEKTRHKGSKKRGENRTYCPFLQGTDEKKKVGMATRSRKTTRRRGKEEEEEKKIDRESRKGRISRGVKLYGNLLHSETAF